MLSYFYYRRLNYYSFEVLQVVPKIVISTNNYININSSNKQKQFKLSTKKNSSNEYKLVQMNKKSISNELKNSSNEQKQSSSEHKNSFKKHKKTMCF